MASKLGLLCILLLSINLVHADEQGLQMSNVSEEVETKQENLCTLCEQFTSQALDYISNNKTQEEVIVSLHRACSQLHHFSEQCVLLVDYYAPLFFLEVGLIQPEAFCTKVNLCGPQLAPRFVNRQDACAICENTIVEVLTKLKDPETQLEIIQILLKVCNKVEQYKQQCKKMVFEYGPLILVNAEKFLETTNVCLAIGACKSAKMEIAAE